MSVVSDLRLVSFPSKYNTFTRALLDYTTRYGNYNALIDPHTKEKLTFSDLCSTVSEIKQQLAGIKKGTIIASICGNSIQVLLTYLAAIDLGAIIVPVNPASKQYEIKKYLMGCKVQYVLTEEEYVKKIEEVLVQPKFNRIHTIILEELLKREPVQTENSYEPEEEDTAFIFFSSGTSGPPKAIRHNHRTLLAHLRQIMSVIVSNHEMFPFPLVSSIDIVHGVLPYFHAGGLITVFCMLLQGATVVINKKWNEEGFLRIIQEYKVTVVNIVPPILDFLVKNSLVNSFDLNSLRSVYVGAAKCDENLIRSLKERLPSVRNVIQLYGLTEAGVLLFVTPIGNVHLSSVGRLMPGVRVKIMDEHGDQLGLNEEGLLIVQAPTHMQGYYGLNHAVPYGWFYTGDLACVNDEGFVYITGREKEMIKVRGWQVNPYEIEEAIKANVVGVRDCAVVGIPHEKDGERPKAFIVGQPNINEVMLFVRDTFSSYKQLCEVEIIDAIPRTSSGKILRHQLIKKIKPKVAKAETKVKKTKVKKDVEETELNSEETEVENDVEETKLNSKETKVKKDVEETELNSEETEVENDVEETELNSKETDAEKDVEEKILNSKETETKAKEDKPAVKEKETGVKKANKNHKTNENELNMPEYLKFFDM